MTEAAPQHELTPRIDQTQGHTLDATTDVVPLYRIENPNVARTPDGAVSHEELVGQWFSTEMRQALTYLQKSTQTNDAAPRPVSGVQMVVAHMPADQLEAHRAAHHPKVRESKMEIERDNFIVPRDGEIPTTVIPLDEALGDLSGVKMNNWRTLTEAKRRVAAHVGGLASSGADVEKPGT